MSTERTPAFLPGLELSRILYEEGVRPVLADAFPGLDYAAARVGSGSEVLGLDTPRSADHEWGPRLNLFLADADADAAVDALADEIHDVLARRLPKHVRGWSTHFRRDTGNPLDPVSGHMTRTQGPVDHRVSVDGAGAWLKRQVGDENAELSPAQWLALPQQRLVEVTAGAVFRDDAGTLTAARARLAWYPDEVWRYLLACQWQRLSQEEAFVGRCAEVGDDLGSAVVAARLVRDLMRLCLLLSRTYAPYSKWLGSVFARLPIAERLTPSLRGALAATHYADRERHLCDAYETVARLQNDSGLAEPVDPARRPYHGRPFQVLHAERFAQALARTLTDPALRDRPLTGAVDQWADSTDYLTRSAPGS
ncbi:DUF4037 domain-containing protein [Streptomyces sp. NPDC050085]|uniref:DUF4037 domain-containing protein n=1 Tax=Streptomyces sp. NPDC050085 TaxID=3365600 RepID=UPI0037AFDE62